MDEELKAMLEGAKAQGANDTDLGKIIDMYEADASKKKGGSKPTSTPQKSDSVTPIGSSGGVNSKMKTFNGLSNAELKKVNSQDKPLPAINQNIKNKIKEKSLRNELKSTKVTPENMESISLKTDNLSKITKENQESDALYERNKKDDYSFLDYSKDTAISGVGTFYKSIADTPELLYDIATQTFINPRLEAEGSPFLLKTGDEVADDLGLKNIPADILQVQIKEANERIKSYSDKNGIDPLKAIQDGNYSGAAKLIAGTTIQSAPLMIAAILSGGSSLGLTAVGVSSAATQNSDLKAEHPEMNVNTRIKNAVATGVIEATVGSLFTGASGAVAKRIIADKGVEVGSKIIAKSFRGSLEKVITKNPIVGALGEVAEEMIVEGSHQTKDIITGIRADYDLHAIGNAGVSSTGMGAVNTLAVYGAKGYVKSKDYAKLKSTNKEVFKLRSEIENGNLSDENKAILGLRADRLEAENKKLLGTEIEKVKALPSDIKTELNALNEEFESLKSKFDDIDDADDIPDNLKPAMKEEIKIQAAKNQKRKTEILSQNDGLEVDNDFSNFDGVEPDFNLENGKISSLPLKEQDRLNKLAVEQITGGDKTIEYTKEQVSQKANEIYTNEQTPPTSETKPQAEVPQQAEAEKVDELRDSTEISQNQEVADVEKRRNAELGEVSIKPNLDENGNKINVEFNKEADNLTAEINAKYDNELEALKTKETPKPQEVSPVEDVVATSVEKPSDEQQLLDVKNGDVVSFTYENKSEIPEIFKDKISSEGEINGKKQIKVTIAKSLAEYHLQNEAAPKANTPTNGNVQLGASNVGESGNAKPKSNSKSSVPSSVDGGEVKGDAKIEKNSIFAENKNMVSDEKPLDEKSFFKKYKAVHKDIRSKTDESKSETKKKIQENGFDEGFNVNALPLYKGAERGTDVTSDWYKYKKGDVVYILPKGAFKDGANGYMTKKGFKPTDSEIIYIEYDGQTVYDAYLSQKTKPAETPQPKSKGDAGKIIEPHSEVNTDVETVKKELKLNEVESLIYDSFKGISKDETVDKVDDIVEKWKDNKFGEIEAIESKINDIDIKLEDNGIEIDQINDAENMTAAKKKKAVAAKEKEYDDLQKQQKELEEQKEAVNESLKQIDDVLFHPTEDYNIDLINEVVDKVNNRLETRKSIKEGTNLFPEDANIPEFVAVKKELIKLTDEKTIAEFNNRTAEQIEESKPIIKDIESKAENAERISKKELEKGIDDAEKLLKKPTTKERIAERIKLSDAKIDENSDVVKAKIKAFMDMFPSADINPDDYHTNGFSADAIIDMVAKAAKAIAKGGIVTSEHIKEAIKAYNTHFDDEIDPKLIEERINPKKEAESKTEKETSTDKDMEDFRDSWNKDPNPSGEINQYDSGNTIKREHGELRNNQDYEVQKDLSRVQIGIKAIEHAKRLFGAEYVEKTLSFIEQANLSPEKKAVAYVLLENEMDARAKDFPDNVGVKKLQDLVRAKSQAFLANSARAIGAGRFRVERFRELVKNGFAEEEYTNAILSTKQIKDKERIQQLSQVTSEDVDNESDLQESDVDFEIAEPTVKRNKKAVKKDISDVLAQMRKDLLKVAKGNVAMSSIPYAAQLKAVTPHILKLSKLLAELGGMKTKEIIAEIHNNIKEMFPEIDKNDVSDILKEQAKKKQKPKTDAEKKTDSVKEVVKQALIASGFGKEITITKNQKDAKGNNVLGDDGKVIRIKEQKKVLDWKKLAGEAGTIENIRKNVEASLTDSKYTKAQKKTMQDALEAEYVRLSADVIQKGLDELVRRNTPRKPVDTKTAARKLAELHNYGLFEKNKDSYEKIINNVLGFNELDQKAFDEMKQIAKGYAVLMDSGLSETEMKDAINTLSRRQSRLVATLAFSQADWKFKLAVALSEITNLSTRFKLVNLGNLAENISSGMMARAANNMMDAIANGISGKKTSNKAIRTQSKINARAKLKGITLETAESYGDTSSLLLNHSAVEDYFNNSTTNKVWHAIISTYMAKPVLEGADSYNKILITEAKMVRATIKVLEAKGMSNSEALDYVANAITGESMKEALVKAKALIEKVNKDVGRKLLNDSESSIKSLASDIVKESLVSGGQLSETELKAIYNAAYKSAGKDIGHVSNNWVTDQISSKGAQVEKQVADAIKEKNWGVASGAVVNQIIWKNFISTFVGGGTNWFVKGLQKSSNPLSLISLRDDMMKLKMAGKLDVTTDEGIKNMEESLYRGMNLRSTSATMLMGAIISASIIGGMSASGADDEIAKWLKKNQWAKKFFDKMVPDAVVLMLAINDKDFGRYIAKMVNVKADFFDDQKNTYKILEKYAKGYVENDQVKISKASGDLGAMIGKRFELPAPLRAAKDIKQIYKGVVKGEYDETNYYTSGFLNGFFQGGIIEMWGLRKDPDFQEQQKQGAFSPTKPKLPSLKFNANPQ